MTIIARQPGIVIACVLPLALLLGITTMPGCVNVKTPDVRVNTAPEPVDPSHLPHTSTHDECRAELAKAYQQIDYLQRENAELRRDVRKGKDERDEYKDKYKHQKKHDD